VDCRCALSERARKGRTSERANEGEHDRGYKLSEERLCYRILYSLPKIHKVIINNYYTTNYELSGQQERAT
jgi:hypothetical protein